MENTCSLYQTKTAGVKKKTKKKNEESMAGEGAIQIGFEERHCAAGL
jgi:hypothetical protein